MLPGNYLRRRIGLCPDSRQHQLNGWVLVSATHSFVDKAGVDLVDGYRHWPCVVCIKCELRHPERLEIVLISKEVVELVLVIVANRRDVEEPEIVLKRDPEAAVIFID